MLCYKLSKIDRIRLKEVTTLKSKILKLLREHPETYHSGESISTTLGVTRTAIWKHIKDLKREGFVIESMTNKGYRLIEEPNILNQRSIESFQNAYDFIDFALYLDTVDSTNLEAKRQALNHTKQGIIVAGEQTSGKGRLGRTWVSDANAGLWASLLLRPNIEPESASKVTITAATAMAEAIMAVTNLDVGIKWPNDLVVNGKKTCGILTEMSSELNYVHSIVLGTGVNLSQTAFSDELKDKATSLKLEGANVHAMDLLKSYLDKFSFYYNLFLKGEMETIIKHHKRYSVTLGNEVVIENSGNKRIARAIDIDINGNLIVENQNNKMETIFSGEVSVRGINGYV